MRFFLNGEDLGTAFLNFPVVGLFPAFSLNVRQSVRVNFGQHRFVYPPNEVDGKAFKSMLAASEVISKDDKLLKGVGALQTGGKMGVSLLNSEANLNIVGGRVSLSTLAREASSADQALLLAQAMDSSAAQGADVGAQVEGTAAEALASLSGSSSGMGEVIRRMTAGNDPNDAHRDAGFSQAFIEMVNGPFDGAVEMAAREEADEDEGDSNEGDEEEEEEEEDDEDDDEDDDDEAARIMMVSLQTLFYFYFSYLLLGVDC